VVFQKIANLILTPDDQKILDPIPHLVEVMALNVGVICGMVAAAGLGALVVQAALITGTAYSEAASNVCSSRNIMGMSWECHGTWMEMVILTCFSLW
jgi:hypothetical protein